jgi:cell division protein ZapD
MLAVPLRSPPEAEFPVTDRPSEAGMDASAPEQPAAAAVCYEFPLNERVRTMLRLEDLFDRLGHYASANHPFQHHAALLTLFEIMEVAARADLKSDLIQEMERQKLALAPLRGNPTVEADMLTEVLSRLERVGARILAMQGKIGQELRDNEWLMGIKQRTSIPGGTCEFDLPAYHLWLNLPDAQRHADLSGWIAPLAPVFEGVAIVLRLLRESGTPAHHIAYQGQFQQTLAGRVVQLARVRVSRTLPCAPEVSANKYALNIRFVGFGVGRARMCDSDVEFDLTYCNL